MATEDRPTAGYYEHVEREVGVGPGVRRVQFISIGANKEKGLIAIYRPLDRQAHVYKEGMVDWRPLGEFINRYRRVTDEKLILELDALAREIYN